MQVLTWNKRLESFYPSQPKKTTRLHGQRPHLLNGNILAEQHARSEKGCCVSTLHFLRSTFSCWVAVSVSAAGHLQMLLIHQRCPVAGPSWRHVQVHGSCPALLLCMCMLWSLKMLGAGLEDWGPSWLSERHHQQFCSHGEKSLHRRGRRRSYHLD